MLTAFPRPDPTLKHAKILIVEDESVVAWHVQEALHDLGHQVIAVAATARQAIHIAAEQRPDLVLMDISLQGKTDGVWAAEYLYLRLDLPVVYLTAHADEQTLQRATQTSPFGYLLKPFQAADLHSTIQVALQRHQLERAMKAAQQWYATTLVSIADATIVTDVDGFITFLNPAAEFFTGWTQEQALGEFAGRVLNLIHEETGDAIENPILAALCRGDTVTLPERAILLSRDGSQRPVGDSASPIRNRDGAIVGGVMVFQDMSDRRQMERHLKERNQILEHTQNRLVADLHDRTVQLQQAIACTGLLKRVLEQSRTQDHDVLQLTLEEVGRTLDATYCWATLHTEASKIATVSAEYTRPDAEPLLTLGTRIDIERFPSFYLRLFQRQSWINPDAELLPPPYALEVPQLIVCPIQDSKGVIGEFGIVLSSDAVWSELQTDLIGQIVSQATIAYQTAKGYEIAQSQVLELRHLKAIQEEFIHTVSQDLRVPLTNMRLAIEMLQHNVERLQDAQVSGEAPDATMETWQKIEQYLQILQQEWQTELELVNDLINFQASSNSDGNLFK